MARTPCADALSAVVNVRSKSATTVSLPAPPAMRAASFAVQASTSAMPWPSQSSCATTRLLAASEASSTSSPRRRLRDAQRDAAHAGECESRFHCLLQRTATASMVAAEWCGDGVGGEFPVIQENEPRVVEGMLSRRCRNAKKSIEARYAGAADIQR